MIEGVPLVVAGAALLVLPGPGILLVVAGIARLRSTGDSGKREARTVR
jgi:putative transmembrane protein PGPGW